MCVVQCFVVSTLVSMTPAGPFLFRNYELPEAAEAHAKQVTHRLCFLHTNNEVCWSDNQRRCNVVGTS